MQQTELCTRLSLEKSWVSRAVDRLEEDGLVQRRKSSEDSRVYDIHLSSAGFEQFDQLNRQLNSHGAAVLARIPEAEKETVHRALTLLAQVLETDSEPWLLRRACKADSPAIATLLADQGLPEADFSNWLDKFMVIDQNGVLIGCAAWESYGLDALVRSVAVRSDKQGMGLGSHLAQAVEARLVAEGYHKAWLLCTDALAFWTKQGYVKVDRSAAPDALRKSQEFASACPASATLMHKIPEVVKCKSL